MAAEAGEAGGARFSIAPEIFWRDVEGDLVLFDERSGEYHELNTSASFVWRRIALNRSVDDIIAEAAARRPEQADAIARDVHAFVTAALDLGLVVA